VQILIHADHLVDDYDAFSARSTSFILAALRHYSTNISRVEVHLASEHGPNHGPDNKRCTMEARIEGRGPAVATHHAANVDGAVHGAAHALAKVIDGVFGRAA
jgi:hypothetical protein